MKRAINKFLRNLFRNRVEYMDPKTKLLCRGHLVIYLLMGSKRGKVQGNKVTPPEPILGAIIEPDGIDSGHLVIPSQDIKVL